MRMGVPLIRVPHLLALGALVLCACSGGVVVDRGSTGAGGSGAGGAASSGGTNAGSTGVSSSAVQSSANSVGASSSGAPTSTSASTGGGGAGGGWPQKELCFLWDMDAGPCPPKEEAADHMSMCGFSVFSVDDGPFVKGNECCYTVSGVPNPC